VRTAGGSPKRVGAALASLALAACSAVTEQTPQPTTFPAAGPEAAAEVVAAYLEAWGSGNHAAMYELIDPGLRDRYGFEAFDALHAGFVEMAEVETLEASAGGDPVTIALPPAARPDAFPPPTPTPEPTPDPSGSPIPDPTPAPSVDPDGILEGPVPALAVPFSVDASSARFGELALDREITLVQGPDGWLVRWSPEVLFPELGPDGQLELVRDLGPRGRIVGSGDVVWAETREDGARVYPQEALGGQAIGYATEVTADDLATLAEAGYRAGDLIGRSGLESGAEDLLRGTPGWSLVAVTGDGARTVLYETEMVPGADVTITLDPEIQSVSQQGLVGHGEGATVALDPTNGGVLALASAPGFNPNSMTIGATLAGVPLEPATQGQIFNKAVLGAWPAGSSLKPFTLAAALHTGVVTPSSTRSCPPTWRYNEAFTFHNYEDHTLPGQVSLAQAMAFSCNTTYMPLSFEVYEARETALTDLLKDFGFGAATGIGYVIEDLGIVPDDAWLAANGRGGYTGFEQVQLSIGQGAFLGTPLQLANAYAAIGNGGTLWQPRIVTRATLPDGTVVLEEPPTEIRRVSVSAENLAYVTDTLEAVVTLPYGTGTAAFAGFGIPVAGKSGTAETGAPDPHAWFPAFAPADAPTISVATVLLNIRLGTGGTDAAPLVRNVMAAHFN
jgi:cell division protein FtsI/penicillin-binding protein 2